MAKPCGGPDLLQRMGRPGFPKGLVVLLVGGPEEERKGIEEQLAKLCYQVTTCGTCSEARRELSCKRTAFDIVLAEAALVAKDNSEGHLFLEAAVGLPLVLISSPSTTTECVWRGIEVGAADVLEKPLSVRKLQNIWQHIVRKVMDKQQNCAGALPAKEEETVPLQAGFSPPSSRCTLSSSMSAATFTHLPEEKFAPDNEGSLSGSQDGKEASLDASMSNTSPETSHTVDSHPGYSETTQLHKDGKPAKRARRSKDILPTSAPGPHPGKQPSAIRAYASQSLPPMKQSGSPAVVGMVHPSWANSQTGNNAFRGSVPPGCVWGTPLHPPPGWQGMFPNGAGPLLGSAANNCTISRCHSAPVHKGETFSSSLVNFDSLPDMDSLEDFTDDLLLNDDFLDCGDNFLQEISAASAAEPAVLDKAPIGLHLRKSESLVDLINQHLRQCSEDRQPPAAAVANV